MAAVTTCTDFGSQENKISHCFHCFPHLFAMKWWDWMPWSLFFECWVLSQLFHSPLSLSSRGSLDPLCFLPQGWYHLHIWGYWYFSWQSWFQLQLNSMGEIIKQPRIWLAKKTKTKTEVTEAPQLNFSDNLS